MATVTRNPINVRFPFELRDQPPEVVQAHRYAFQGIVDLNQAIAALKTQIDAIPSSTPTGAGTTSTTTEVVTNTIEDILAGLGTVNDQTGNTSYTTQTSDAGALLILNDGSPVAVSLNSVVSTPFALFITNTGSGLATLTPTSGTINGSGSYTLAQNGTIWTVFDGTNWKTTAEVSISGLTAGFIPLAGSATTITADSHLDDGVTTAGVITSTEPVTVPKLDAGPDESTLLPVLHGYVGPTTVLLTSSNLTALGIEFQADETTNIAGFYVAGACEALTADNPNAMVGYECDVFTDAASTHNFASIQASASFVGHNAAGTLAKATSLFVYQTANTGGGIITGVIGLEIEDQTAGAANWAIKTGLGLVEFGDTVQFDGITKSGTVYSVAGTPLPSAVTAGVSAKAFVSDATAAIFNTAYVGGGANKVPVFSDGTSWLIG